MWYPDEWPEREITWAIVEHKQGKGIAAEAAIRSRAYAYDTLGWDSVFSCITAENLASIQLAEKPGAKLDRKLERKTGNDILVYRHAKETMK